MDDLYCQLFVDCKSPQEQLIAEVATIVGGQANGYTVVSSWGEIDIRENDDWEEGRTDQQDGFLYYRFSNDIEPNDTTDRHSYVTGVEKMIKGLRSLGYKVVPACDFEDEVN